MNKLKLNDEVEIYSTGVFLKAMKVTLNGVEQIRWIAISFEDSSFLDGLEIDVHTYGNTFEGLITDEIQNK